MGLLNVMPLQTVGSDDIVLTSGVRIGVHLGSYLQAGGFGISPASHASMGGRGSSIFMVGNDWGSLDLLP